MAISPMCLFYVAILLPCLTTARPGVTREADVIMADLRTISETYKDGDEYPIDVVIGAFEHTTDDALFHLFLTNSGTSAHRSDGRLYTNYDQSRFILQHVKPGCYALQGVLSNPFHKIEIESKHPSDEFLSKMTGVKHHIRMYASDTDEDKNGKEESSEDHDDGIRLVFNTYTNKDWKRIKRATTQYTVELLMVIDHAIYERWSNLIGDSNNKEAQVTDAVTQYYHHVFKGIDARFRSIEKQTYKINLAMSGLVIAKTESESHWTLTSALDREMVGPRLLVNASEALEKFQTWLDSSVGLPTFDHAMLFTGTDLSYAGSDGNTGLAFAESMCRNISNSSVVEDSFDFRTITFATQQIARSLGARDDMDNNDCLEFFNYIMSPKLKLPVRSFPSNRWKFSTCSELYFKDYISNIGDDSGNCLLETAEGSLDMSAPGHDLAGKEYNATQQCQHHFGLQSDVCRIQIGPYYSKLCTGLLCLDPDRAACGYILPADGTPCGNRKYCFTGKCLEFEDALPSSDSCVFGNEPGANCEERIYERPFLCYNDTIRYSCCKTCEYVTIELPGCEYGDRIGSCAVNECALGNTAYVTDTCCLTCADDPSLYVIPTRSFPSTTTVPTSTQPDTTSASVSLSSTQSTTVNNISYSSEPKSISSTISTQNVTSPTLTSTTDNKTSTMSTLSDIRSVDASTIITTSTTPTVAADLSTQRINSIATSMETMTETGQPVGIIVEETTTSILRSNPTESRVSSESNTDVASTDKTKTTKYSSTSEGISWNEFTTIDVTPHPVDITPKVTKQQKTQQPCVDAGTTSTKAPPTTTTPLPVHTTSCKHAPKPAIYEKTMSVVDRKFFFELAKAMRQKQRRIRQETQYDIHLLYRAISLQIQNYQESDNESVFFMGRRARGGERPSNDDDDLNRLLRPMWLAQHRQLVQNLERNIKQMRYKVLALVSRHLRK